MNGELRLLVKDDRDDVATFGASTGACVRVCVRVCEMSSTFMGCACGAGWRFSVSDQELVLGVHGAQVGISSV